MLRERNAMLHTRRAAQVRVWWASAGKSTSVPSAWWMVVFQDWHIFSWDAVRQARRDTKLWKHFQGLWFVEIFTSSTYILFLLEHGRNVTTTFRNNNHYCFAFPFSRSQYYRNPTILTVTTECEAGRQWEAVFGRNEWIHNFPVSGQHSTPEPQSYWTLKLVMFFQFLNISVRR